MRKFFPHGFTLIELLIVVAIIAILAAIAIPNFLEAQVRAKVSSVKNNMRSIATALEAYRVDQNNYPPDAQYLRLILGDTTPYLTCLFRLTTPVAFMSSVPVDNYGNRWAALSYPQGDSHRKQFDYRTGYGWGLINSGQNPAFIWPDVAAVKHKANMKGWVLNSSGPDQDLNYGEHLLFGELCMFETMEDQRAFFSNTGGFGCLYDPTNGTTSAGDIARSGP